MKRIGIAGAGIMASGMALNSLTHGYTVSVWNRGRDRLLPLLDKGTVAAQTPRELAASSNIVIECVSDDDASCQVWLGRDVCGPIDWQAIRTELAAHTPGKPLYCLAEGAWVEVTVE